MFAGKGSREGQAIGIQINAILQFSGSYFLVYYAITSYWIVDGAARARLLMVTLTTESANHLIGVWRFDAEFSKVFLYYAPCLLLLCQLERTVPIYGGNMQKQPPCLTANTCARARRNNTRLLSSLGLDRYPHGFYAAPYQLVTNHSAALAAN
jgi:hypothetical protein